MTKKKFKIVTQGSTASVTCQVPFYDQLRLAHRASQSTICKHDCAVFELGSNTAQHTENLHC